LLERVRKQESQANSRVCGTVNANPILCHACTMYVFCYITKLK